ncbi:MAG: glycosyltransferase family 2 protein [Candidatus Omnitrophica bacterium]|nr:glycosyltransferase family 2 protein [Candidatus Omnitrophota bacterium]
MKCDIIIPVWNQLEATKECIDSILKNTNTPFRFVIIDNGSDLKTSSFLDALASVPHLDIKVLRNSANLGFVKAANQGLAASDSPYICLMNNDTIATSGWLEEMLSVLDSKEDIGIVNPSSNTSGQFPPKGLVIESFALSLKSLKGQVQELNVARGFCMLMKRAVLEKVGLFDEDYNIGYFEETDFSKRAQEAGFTIVRAKASYVYHKEGISFKELDRRESLFKANESIYFRKWGRRVRAAYLAEDLSFGAKVDKIAAAVARDGHQMLILTKKGVEWPITIDHFDVRKQEVACAPFALGSFLQLLKRRRKKAIEVVLTDNPLIGNFLKALSFLHGAKVAINPEKDSVLNMLRRLSRKPK